MGTKQLLVAASAFSLLATSAQAQAGADPRDAEIQALRAQVQALAARLDQLQARIDAPAAPAVIQTPAQYATAGGATIVGGKPSIQSADGRFVANLHAIMQFDAADYQQAAPGPVASDFRRGAAAGDTGHARDLSSGTNFRRARLGIDGRAFGDWDYNAAVEFGGAGEEDAGHLYEAWIQYS